MKLPKTNQKGFTIIEVLIVLAIAGLILLIVFLAVPALQRNSRNTTARNEAASVLGAANEFMSNNNGKAPASGDATSVFNNVKAQQLTGITIEGATGTTVPSATNAVLVVPGKCVTASNSNVNGTGRSAIVAAGTSRQMAIIYLTETGADQQLSCTEG